MRDALSRLYRTKTLLIAVITAVLGVALIAVGNRITRSGSSGLLAYLPVAEVGGTLLGASLFGLWLDLFMQREQQAVAEQRLRALLHEHAPAMRDAVLDAFAANHQDLRRVATPEMLDGIIENSLEMRLGDQQFAHEIYRDLRDNAIAAGERWYDASVSIELSPTVAVYRPGKDGPTFRTSKKLFTVSVRWEYKTIPRYPQRRFACVSDRAEFNELAAERGATTAWFMKPAAGLDAASPEAFELTRFTVDGDERPIRRTSRKGGQVYTANVGTDVVEAGKPVTVAYSYRTVTTQAGHLLYFNVDQPTRDLTISFDYSDCDLATVSVLDLIPSTRQTRIERPNKEVPASVLRADIDGWIFPRSGVGFVWTMNSEASVRTR